MRHILHADFDAFFTSVEQLDDPSIRGKPVVVGGRPEDRGVVASASYEARRFGIQSAMPMRTALQRCPQAILIPPRFGRYQKISRQVLALFREVTPLMEPLSIDEAFLDVTEVAKTQDDARRIAAGLRARVHSKLGLTISIGVATSKSLAKIASDMDKPNSLTVVPEGFERQFLAPLPVGKLPGIGPKTAARLESVRISVIGDLADRSEEWYIETFGRSGANFRRLSLGQDDSPIVVERKRKSVSAETTLASDTDSPEVLQELVDRLSQRVSHHLARSELRGRTIKLKLRLSDFTTFTRQRTLQVPEASPDKISSTAKALLQRELQPGKFFRLIGVGVSGFDLPEITPVQFPLSGFE